MIAAALRRPVTRIVLALVISALLHSLIMWLPGMRFPHKDKTTRPITVRLEPLPQPAVVPQTAPVPAPIPAPALKRGQAQQPRPRVEPATPLQPAPAPSSEVAPASAKAEPAEAVVHEAPVPVPQVDTASAPVAAAPMPEGHWARPVLPKHAQLVFSVYKGSSAFMVGEVHHALDIKDGRYVLKAETRTVGLAKLLKTYQLTQTSRGMAEENGLHPENYEEEKDVSGSTQKLDALFDWPTRTMQFSNGETSELPADAQDTLSMLYQLSQSRMDREIIKLTISNGKKLEKYELEIGRQEEISTPLGMMHGLHLRKLHSPGEEGMEIWLGLEYRMLPVKVRYIERSGEVAAEAVISDIRVAD
jgi:hypothetical protein